MLWFENGFDEAFDLWFSCLNQREPLCIKRKPFCINIFCVSFVINHLCLIYKKNPHCGLNCYGKQSMSSKLTSYNTRYQCTADCIRLQNTWLLSKSHNGSASWRARLHMVDYCDPEVLNNLPVQHIFSNNQTWMQIWWALSKREILETITSYEGPHRKLHRQVCMK